jgi:hypothetical protein
MKGSGSCATSALCGRAGPVTFANRGKSNQKRLPLHPASSSGARVSRDARSWQVRVARILRCRYAECAQENSSWTAKRSAPRRGLKGLRTRYLIDSRLERATRSFPINGFAHFVISLRLRYNKNTSKKSEAYDNNQKNMICTIKKLYARSAYKPRWASSATIRCI